MPAHFRRSATFETRIFETALDGAWQPGQALRLSGTLGVPWTVRESSGRIIPEKIGYFDRPSNVVGCCWIESWCPRQELTKDRKCRVFQLQRWA